VTRIHPQYSPGPLRPAIRDQGQECRLSSESRAEKTEGSTASGDASSSKVACVSPMTSGLPRSWDNVGVGHMVLVHESPADGWWEAVVVQREDEVLTLRFRDYPKLPTFVRHISTIALVNPGPTAQAT
jgi:hypothetical protein